jgi:hypothetical protein
MGRLIRHLTKCKSQAAWERRWKCLVFVVELTSVQVVVVELAEKSVEQVPSGLVVPVSGGAAGIAVFGVRPGSGATRPAPR